VTNDFTLNGDGFPDDRLRDVSFLADSHFYFA